jgi:protein TonB
MRRTFLALDAAPWGLSLLVHGLALAALLYLGRSRVVDLEGLTLDLSTLASAPASGAAAPPKEELWRRPNAPSRIAPPPPKKEPESLAPPAPAPPAPVSGNAPAYRSIAEVSRLPQALSLVKPGYPPAARQAGVEGTVILQVDIDATGAVKRVDLIQGLGYGCDEAAIDALWKTPFRPAFSGDTPVPVQGLRIPYRFTLSGTDNP